MKHDKKRDKDADRIAVALYRDAMGEDFFAGDEGEELQVLRRIAAAAPALLAENERLRELLSGLLSQIQPDSASQALIKYALDIRAALAGGRGEK